MSLKCVVACSNGWFIFLLLLVSYVCFLLVINSTITLQVWGRYIQNESVGCINCSFFITIFFFQWQDLSCSLGKQIGPICLSDYLVFGLYIKSVLLTGPAGEGHSYMGWQCIKRLP